MGLFDTLFNKKKEPPDFPPKPKWKPNLPIDIDAILERAKYTGEKLQLAVFSHGTFIIFPEKVRDIVIEGLATLDKIYNFRPDFKPMVMDDGNYLIEYSQPAFTIVFKDELGCNFNKMKRELIWWNGFLVVAFIAIGQMTSFKFRNIDIQLHDTYYIVPSWVGIIIVLTILGLLRGLTRIADRLSDRSRLLAILISIINGLLIISLIALIRVAIYKLIQAKEWYPDLNISNYIGIIAVMVSILLLLIIIEIKTVRKLSATKE